MNQCVLILQLLKEQKRSFQWVVDVHHATHIPHHGELEANPQMVGHCQW
jgi:hypothetical protein